MADSAPDLDTGAGIVLNLGPWPGLDLDSNADTTRFALTIVLPFVLAAAVIAATLVQARAPAPIVAAAEVVESLHVPGDLVLLYPEARFPDLELLPERFDAIAASSLPPEADRYARVFLVRPRGDHVPPIRRVLATRSALLFATDVADLTVELFQLDEPERVVLDLGDALATARAWVEPADDPEPIACPWAADRFDCPDADWTWIGPTVQVFAGEPHRCIWMHPVDDADVVLEFPDVTGTHVTGWYGMTDYAVSIPDGTAVRLTLIAGERRERFRAHRQTGRRPLRFALPDDYSGPLRMEVSAPRAGVRHFCFDLQVVSAEAP